MFAMTAHQNDISWLNSYVRGNNSMRQDTRTGGIIRSIRAVSDSAAGACGV